MVRAGHRLGKIVFVVFLVIQILWVTSIPAFAALLIITGAFPHDYDAIAIRYRSFGNTGGDEVYLGANGLGDPLNRVAQDFGATPWGAVNLVNFTYDKVNDRLIGTIDIGDNGSVDFTLIYPNISVRVAALGMSLSNLNIMTINVVCRDAGTTVDYNNVNLTIGSNTYPLGNFSSVPTQWNTWTVAQVDFSQGFTLSGKILLSGPFGGSQELSKIEVLVGYSSPPTQAAIVPNWGMPGSTVNATITGTGFRPGATVRLIKTGSSDIVGTGTTVPDSNTINTTFNLAGAALGQWNVVVENLDGQVCNTPVTFIVGAATGANNYPLIMLALMSLAIGVLVLGRPLLAGNN